MKRNPAGGAVYGVTMCGTVRHVMQKDRRYGGSKCGADADRIRAIWNAEFRARIATWPVCKRCQP